MSNFYFCLYIIVGTHCTLCVPVCMYSTLCTHEQCCTWCVQVCKPSCKDHSLAGPINHISKRRHSILPCVLIDWSIFFSNVFYSCSKNALTAHLIFDILHLDWSIDASKIYGMLLVSAQSWDCTHPIKSSNFCTFYLWSFLYLTLKLLIVTNIV